MNIRVERYVPINRCRHGVYGHTCRAICSDQPVCDRCVVFNFVARWKEGFVNMINRTFARLLTMGVFSRDCSGVFWGMRESVVSDSGRGHWLCSLHVAPSNGPNLCIYVFYYVLYYINSLCSGGFTDATASMYWFGVWWVHDTDVSRTGCTRLGSTTRRVSFYVSLCSLVDGGLRLSGPSSGRNGSVRVYRRVILGKQNWRYA
jgi:hypothetical protein